VSEIVFCTITKKNNEKKNIHIRVASFYVFSSIMSRCECCARAWLPVSVFDFTYGDGEAERFADEDRGWYDNFRFVRSIAYTDTMRLCRWCAMSCWRGASMRRVRRTRVRGAIEIVRKREAASGYRPRTFEEALATLVLNSQQQQ
jgi:hypothetical protein